MTEFSHSDGGSLAQRIAGYRQRLGDVGQTRVEGKLKRVVGTMLEAVGCKSAVGGYCMVETVDGNWLETEVVGFANDKLLLMPTGELRGVMPNARVIPIEKGSDVPVGDGLLGRVLDGAGRPLDGRGSLHCSASRPLSGEPINPLSRQPIRQPLDVGVRAINSLLTVGRGQRLGLFAGSGVGKSVLLGMMTRFTSADVVVVALIGERGREVKEFIDSILGPEEMRRAVVVATPADHPPLMRMRAAWLATSIAEHFRDQGKQVLLLMDSLTRFAQAQREIALAVGEPPATKGYPPSVFARLPALVERAGNGEAGGGSITAFYTVLAEGDDQNDPIVDSARAILDGHIVLSRALADAGHFPAIDIEKSVSRAMNDITEKGHQDTVRYFRQMYSLYQQNRDLITIGAYQRGSDARLDEAVSLWPKISGFLQQAYDESETFDRSLDELSLLVSGTE
ncbi:flagellar protein export ATPase FliI [Spongiibacter taiwanensis]|uniref:flagellar protein export ATPase FliI n=1 Tax=Spongiibacter taiwanensis TaxID=1748242 RepID=UPI0020358B59|nr:flagellar protein export ATPase FliI [Spongiibacter taiwanensis]USA43794.1 flagellar protein export ATPase FliI [Spongiibacter taiwanensis]